MKFLVTGGCGFIGSNLVCTLITHGHTVTVLDIDISPLANQKLPGVAVVEGSVTDEAVLSRAMTDCDGVFHLAAVSSAPDCELQPTHCIAVNVEGTRNVLRVARNRGAIPVVYASTAAVYGEGASASREADVARPRGNYGHSKLQAEAYARADVAAFAGANVGLRLFNVYGPSASNRPARGVVNRFVSKVISGEAASLFGDANQVRDFVAVGDAVRFLVAAMALNRSGAYVANVCTGVGTPIKALVAVIEDVVGRPIAFNRVPAPASEIRHSRGDPQYARELLGLDCATPLRAGIEALVAAALRRKH